MPLHSLVSGFFGPPPPWVISVINSALLIFSGLVKQDKVSRSVVSQPKSVGGFNVVDASTKFHALHVSSIHRLCQSSSSWTLFFNYFCLAFLATIHLLFLLTQHIIPMIFCHPFTFPWFMFGVCLVSLVFFQICPFLSLALPLLWIAPLLS